VTRRRGDIAETLRQRLLSGIDLGELKNRSGAFVGWAFDGRPHSPPRRMECTADQLYSVLEELQRDFGIRTTGIEIDSILAGQDAPVELRKVDLLVTTPFTRTKSGPSPGVLACRWS